MARFVCPDGHVVTVLGVRRYITLAHNLTENEGRSLDHRDPRVSAPLA